MDRPPGPFPFCDLLCFLWLLLCSPSRTRWTSYFRGGPLADPVSADRTAVPRCSGLAMASPHGRPTEPVFAVFAYDCADSHRICTRGIERQTTRAPVMSSRTPMPSWQRCTTVPSMRTVPPPNSIRMLSTSPGERGWAVRMNRPPRLQSLVVDSVWLRLPRSDQCTREATGTRKVERRPRTMVR